MVSRYPWERQKKVSPLKTKALSVCRQTVNPDFIALSDLEVARRFEEVIELLRKVEKRPTTNEMIRLFYYK